MAWQNAGWNDTDWSPPDWFEYAAGPLPGADSAFTHERWVGTNRWSHTRWLDTDILASGTFNQAGLAASSDAQGFVAGFSNIVLQQGTAATVGSTASWAGFSPDPGGILDNDSDPDGDALSHNPYLVPTINGRPEYDFPAAGTNPDIIAFEAGAGTVTVYAGGAFDWVFSIGTPAGIYQWAYGLHASDNGLEQDIGKVSMEHGQVYASADVQGFAGQFNFDYQEQGSAATAFVTGFGGELLLTINDQGTAGASAVTTFAGTITFGWAVRGTAATVDVQGFAGGLVDTFDSAGTAATVTPQGFAGTLDVGVFFNDQGTAGASDVQGFAGEISTSFFIAQGSAGAVGAQGLVGNILLGFSGQGTAATAGALGFSPVTTAIEGGQFVIEVLAEVLTIEVVAEDFDILVLTDDFEIVVDP